jgi:hypothetical protein
LLALPYPTPLWLVICKSLRHFPCLAPFFKITGKN